MPAGVVDLPNFNRLLAEAERWQLPSLRSAIARRRLLRERKAGRPLAARTVALSTGRDASYGPT